MPEEELAIWKESGAYDHAFHTDTNNVPFIIIPEFKDMLQQMKKFRSELQELSKDSKGRNLFATPDHLEWLCSNQEKRMRACIPPPDFPQFLKVTIMALTLCVYS